MVHVERLGPQIGAEIHGVDGKKLDDASFAEIYRAWLGHNGVVLTGRDLEIEGFRTYSRLLGFGERHPPRFGAPRGEGSCGERGRAPGARSRVAPGRPDGRPASSPGPLR